MIKKCIKCELESEHSKANICDRCRIEPNWLDKKWYEWFIKCTHKIPSLYVLSVYKNSISTGIYKIGSSNSVHKRLFQLSNTWFKVGVEFRWVETFEHHNFRQLEKFVGTRLRESGNQYAPKNKLEGHLEFYKTDIRSITKLVEEFNSLTDF